MGGGVEKTAERLGWERRAHAEEGQGLALWGEDRGSAPVRVTCLRIEVRGCVTLGPA